MNVSANWAWFSWLVWGDLHNFVTLKSWWLQTRETKKMFLNKVIFVPCLVSSRVAKSVDFVLNRVRVSMVSKKVELQLVL